MNKLLELNEAAARLAQARKELTEAWRIEVDAKRTATEALLKVLRLEDEFNRKHSNYGRFGNGVRS